MQCGEHQIHRGISNPLEPINCIDFYRIFFVYISFVREFIIQSLLLYCIIFLNVIGNVSEKFWKFEDLFVLYVRRKNFNLS